MCHISRVKIDQIKVVNILIISEEFAYGEAPFDGAFLHAELLPNRQWEFTTSRSVRYRIVNEMTEKEFAGV